MTRNGTRWVVACGMLFASGCGGAEFKEFSPTDGRFKVQMPGTPKEETQTAAGVPLKIYSVTERDGAYAVVSADLPIPAGESEAQLQARLDGARDGMIRNINATFTSESKITLNGKYPGREVQAELADKKGILRARIYLADRRMYQVMVTGTQTWATSDSANKFLESLVLTQQPKSADAGKKNLGHNPQHDLTKVETLEKYQISLPKDFTDLPAPKNLPPFVKTYVWQGSPMQNVPSAIISVTVITEEKAVDEAKKNVRQFLVNFSAGVTESSGIKIAQRGPTEQFTFNGLAFSRFKWTGAGQNQKPVTGLAYGAIIGADVVAITTLHLDSARGAETGDLMESIVATFKKK